MANVRIAEYPGAVGVHAEELVVENVENVLFNRSVENLTQSVAGEASAALSTRRPDDIVYEGSFEDVNEYFRSREWSDELPIVPPTVEKVEAFLKRTRRAPDEAIANNTYNPNNIGTTWGVFPFLLVNGPAARLMGVENGGQLVNKGANPALGRALGLMIRNIAG